MFFNFDDLAYRNGFVLLGLIYGPGAWYRFNDNRHVL